MAAAASLLIPLLKDNGKYAAMWGQILENTGAKMDEKTIRATGNGPLDAFCTALRDGLGLTAGGLLVGLALEIAIIFWVMFGVIAYYMADGEWIRKKGMQNGFIAILILLMVFPGVLAEMLAEAVLGEKK